MDITIYTSVYYKGSFALLRFQVIVEFYTMSTDDINLCLSCGAYFNLKILYVMLTYNPNYSNHADI